MPVYTVECHAEVEGTCECPCTLVCRAGVEGTCECPCMLWNAMQRWKGRVNARVHCGGPCRGGRDV